MSQQTARSAPALYATAQEFLLSRGWTPNGNHAWPECKWTDPLSAPSLKKESKQVFVLDENGQRVPLLRDNGRSPHPHPQPVFQTHLTFPGQPVSLEEALDAQLSRESKAEVSE